MCVCACTCTCAILCILNNISVRVCVHVHAPYIVSSMTSCAVQTLRELWPGDSSVSCAAAWMTQLLTCTQCSLDTMAQLFTRWQLLCMFSALLHSNIIMWCQCSVDNFLWIIFGPLKTNNVNESHLCIPSVDQGNNKSTTKNHHTLA